MRLFFLPLAHSTIDIYTCSCIHIYTYVYEHMLMRYAIECMPSKGNNMFMHVCMYVCMLTFDEIFALSMPR